ncbi:hypothetical protein I7I48_10653 [Histoplasma ohiense]|nr:hypothetical protein I7I48_10653 [Histoplasma ohiense (nom. inval.)]
MASTVQGIRIDNRHSTAAAEATASITTRGKLEERKMYPDAPASRMLRLGLSIYCWDGWILTKCHVWACGNSSDENK